MEENDKKIIEKELDKVLEKFNNEGFISQDFHQASKTMKHAYFNNLGLHKKSRECIFPSCSKQSIKKSHSIPKSSSLLNIAKKGHLLKPEFDLTSSFPVIKMVKLGVNNASVFPGYCEEHERIFTNFELDCKFDDAKKALLQTYRTICRERTWREIEIDINDEIKRTYKSKINEDALKEIRDSLSHYPQFSQIENIEITGVDSVLNSLDGYHDFIKSSNKDLHKLENKILQILYGNSRKDELLIRVINVDIKFPISLCGFGTQKYVEKEIERVAYVFLNVIPLKESTYIICLGSEKDKTIFEKYCDFSFENPINMLNMIESFMVNGSDHWYINPDIWNGISKDKQEKILYDILVTEDSFFDEYPISIFDDIRLNLLKMFEENTKHRELTIDENLRIKAEQIKIKRMNYEIIRDDEKYMKRMLSKIER